MCGVIACISLSGELHPNLMKRLLTLLHHRGPDASGISSSGIACFGHRRLSILDINSNVSKQPINKDGSMLSFNGEIYNFKELIPKLREDGVYCSGKSDTEVLFNCLNLWGIDKTLSLIDGMYAFAFRDGRDGSVYFARDPLGEKPLYWSKSKDRFWASSEIKVLLATGELQFEPNLSKLDDYFFTGKVNGQETIFKNIYEVEPGTYIHLKPDKIDPQVIRHWSLEEFTTDKTIEWGSKVIESFETKLQAVMASRRISDVPLGLLLSGGIDSNTILEMSLANLPDDQIALYFADNRHKELSERKDVNLIVKQMKEKYPAAKLSLYSEFMDFDSYILNLDNLTWFYDEPIQFPISPQLSALIKIAKEQGNKVLLSGEGADEILFGYDRFTRVSKIINACDNRQNKIRNAYFGGGIDKVNLVSKLTSGIGNGAESTAPWQWLEKNVDKYDFDILQMLFSQKFRLQTLLQRQDRGGMAESIEIRVPFLAPNLVRWCNSLPMKIRYDKSTGETKRILRAVMKHRLPARILKKEKQGSTSDVQKWLRTEQMKNLCQDMVNDKNGFCQSYLDGKFASQLLENHFSSKNIVDVLVWMFLTIELWFRKFRSGVKLPQLDI
jgi:asparagine synthase (glutamine-hydrolysing)